MKVKICGICHPDDAEHAAMLGADYFGMIFYENSRRNVSFSLSKKILERIKDTVIEPVGVFVDQTKEQIHSICKQIGIRTIQLHGKNARQALPYLLDDYSIIYSISVEKNGSLSGLQTLPPSVITLFDHSQGGSGVPFEWKNFVLPTNSYWMLAGGLNPNNVEEAITLLNPNVVDVSTGIEFPGTTRKNPLLMKSFIQIAKQSR